MTTETKGYATELRPPDKRIAYRWKVMATNYSVLTLNYVDRTALAIVAPLMIADLGLSTSTFGWVLTAFFVGYIPTCFYGGYWADRHGPRKVMAGAIFVWSLFTAMTAIGFNLISMIVIRFLFGFGEGPQTAASTKTMSNWFPQRRLSTAVGMTLSAQPIGGAIGAPLTVAVVAIFGNSWRAPFILFGVLGVVFLIGWWAVVRDSPLVHPKVGPVEAEEMAEDERIQAAAHGISDPGARARVWPYMCQPLVMVTVFAYFGAIWLFYTFLNWFPLFLTQVHGLNLKEMAFGSSVPWIAGTVGMAISGVVTDHVAKRMNGRLFEARKRVFVVSILIVSVLISLVSFAGTPILAVGLMAGVLLVLYVALALPHSIVASAVPKQVYGSASGIAVAFGNLGGAFSPVVIGYILEGTNNSWGIVFGLGAVVAVLPALILAWFKRPVS